MAIQLHNANIRPVAQTGAVRANPAALSDTGEKEVWGGVAAMGQSLNIFAGDMYKAAGRMEISSAERKRDERLLAAYDELEAVDMPQTSDEWTKAAGEIYQRAKKDIDGFAPKQPGWAAAYKMSNDERLPFFTHKFNSDAKKRYIGKLKADLDININSAIKRGDYDAAGAVVADAVEAGLYTKTQAKEVLKQVRYDINKETIWNSALAAGDKGIDVVNAAEGLTAEDKMEMGRSIKFFADQQEAAAKKQLEAQQEAQRLDLVNKLADGSLDWQFIATTSLDAAEKNQWREKAEARIKALKDGKDDPLNQSDSKVLLEISKKINLDQAITKDELADKVGNGLSISDFEKYAKDIDDKTKMSPDVKIRRQIGVDKLKTVFEDSGIWGEDSSSEEIAIYAKRMQQWDDFWRKNPNATAVQADEFMGLLTEDVYNQLFNKYDKNQMTEIDDKIAEILQSTAAAGVDKFVLGQELDIDYEPANEAEFEKAVAGFGDDEMAKEYYDKWVKKFKK